MRAWDLPATWAACQLRWEVLNEIPAELRTEAEERARIDLARWLAEHEGEGR